MSPSQRRPNASQPILACPKTCSSRLSSVPRPSRQSEGVRRLAIDQLSDRWRAPPSRFPNRRVPNRSTTRQGLSHEPSQATKKKRKKKESFFFFKQTTIVRSCGLPNYETKLIFFLFYFFFVLNQGPRNRLAHPVGWYRVFFVFFFTGFSSGSYWVLRRLKVDTYETLDIFVDFHFIFISFLFFFCKLEISKGKGRVLNVFSADDTKWNLMGDVSRSKPRKTQ